MSSRLSFWEGRRRVTFRILALLYMSAILILSSIPGDSSETTFRLVAWVPPALQNLLHVPLYAGLSLLWCVGLADPRSSGRGLVLALLISVGFGALDESYQSLVPGRIASLTDGTLNLIGSLLGLLLWRWGSARASR